MKSPLIVPIACLALACGFSPAVAQPNFADDPPWADPPTRIATEPPHASDPATLDKNGRVSEKVTAIVEIRTREPERLLRLATPAVEAVGGQAELIQWSNRENSDNLALEVIADEERMLDIIATVQSLDREAAEADAKLARPEATPSDASTVPDVHFFEGSAAELAGLRPIQPESIEPAPQLQFGRIDMIESSFSANDEYSAPPKAERLVTPTATYRI